MALQPNQDPQDLHANEDRFLSERWSPNDYPDAAVDEIEQQFRGFSVRMITERLQAGGVHAAEFPVVRPSEKSKIPFTLYGRLRWQPILEQYNIPPTPFDPYRVPIRNAFLGLNLAAHFIQWCQENDHDMARMYEEDGMLATSRVEQCLVEQGWRDIWHTVQVTSAFDLQCRKQGDIARALKNSAMVAAVDPDHVPVPHMLLMYKAWSVTEDTSVDGTGMLWDRYREVITGHRFQSLFEFYKFFGAEVVSPILPAGREETYGNIRRVCGVLRDNFRIHKPMEVSTGLHVHLGNLNGWSLLQLKRFATMWYLIEVYLIYIHRFDRGTERMSRWCGRYSGGSALSQALAGDGLMRARYQNIFPRVAPQTRARNQAAMEEHVPIDLFDDTARDWITHIWQYTDIGSFCDAVSGGIWYDNFGFDNVRPSARIRVSGQKRSGAPEQGLPQTIEIRTMQGTLDGDHIVHWLKVLERVVYFTRRASTAEYYRFLDNASRLEFNSNSLAPLLIYLGVPNETSQYFFDYRRRANKQGHRWFAYPDHDRVDWTDPFMVPGHGATHGPEFD